MVDYIVQLRQQLREQGLSAVKIWKAMAIETPAQLPDLPVDAFVLDNRKGGSGQVFDWSLLENLTPRQRQRCLLAGGIGPESIDEAITLGFAGVDMNSRVDWTPGIKNSQKVSQTFMKIRQYGRFSNKKFLNAFNGSCMSQSLPAYFGDFGGQFVPEILLPALEQLEQAFIDTQQDEESGEFRLTEKLPGRPTPRLP